MPPHFHQSKLILIREIIPKNKAVEFSAALSHTADFEFYRLRGNEWTVIPYGGP